MTKQKSESFEDEETVASNWPFFNATEGLGLSCHLSKFSIGSLLDGRVFVGIMWIEKGNKTQQNREHMKRVADSIYPT